MNQVATLRFGERRVYKSWKLNFAFFKLNWGCNLRPSLYSNIQLQCVAVLKKWLLFPDFIIFCYISEQHMHSFFCEKNNWKNFCLLFQPTMLWLHALTNVDVHTYMYREKRKEDRRADEYQSVWWWMGLECNQYWKAFLRCACL